MKLRKELSRSIWNIGFLDIKSKDDLLSEWDIHLMKHHENKWFADPFILDVNDQEIKVLVEEMDFNREKGRIACLIVNRLNYELQNVEILLELDTHLSFPAIIRRNDEVYVYPENSESGNLVLYKYDFKNRKLTKNRTIINQPLTDAVYYKSKDGEYIFSTQLPDPNGAKLNVYKRDLDNVYSRLQTVEFSDNTARNAGDIFELDELLIRPAQNCNGYYGIGIVFQQVLKDETGFAFKEIGRVDVPHGYNGMHTFNTYKGVTVIDMRRPIHPFIHSSYMKMKKLLNGL